MGTHNQEHTDGAVVQLSPDLPAPVFYCTESWHQERIGAAVLYCSDGRWGEAFDEFCHRHLQIPRYDRLAAAGGPAWLGKQVVSGEGLMVRGNEKTEPVDHSPLTTHHSPALDWERAARSQLDFLVRVHELERLVLITHYGCAYYAERLKRGPKECLPSQMDDVRLGAERLRRWYPGLSVEGYVAMRTGGCLSFHRLEV